MSIRILSLPLLLSIALHSSLSAEPLGAFGPAGPVTKLHGDFQFTEGPTDDGQGNLYFTDIPANTIYRLDSDRMLHVFARPSGHANGLMYESGGRIVACQMDGQLVVYDLESAEATTLADEYEGKRFNAPNDLIVDADGGVYFTDPLFRAPMPLPQGTQAFYYLDAAGQVTRMAGDLPAPNGVALSPDGERLYLIPSHSAEMLAYPVEGPGRLGEPEVFCRLKQKSEGGNSGGDGLAVDVEGNVYITSDLGVQVFDAAGELLGIIEVPEQPANVAFGGPERKTMYITARNGLYAVELKIAGVPPQALRAGSE